MVNKDFHHFVLISCNATSSDAMRPTSPKTAVAAR